MRADRQTDRHTDALIAILLTRNGAKSSADMIVAHFWCCCSCCCCCWWWWCSIMASVDYANSRTSYLPSQLCERWKRNYVRTWCIKALLTIHGVIDKTLMH